MRRKRRIFQHSNTQGYPLREHIDLHHPLVELAGMIDWAAIDRVATACRAGASDWAKWAWRNCWRRASRQPSGSS